MDADLLMQTVADVLKKIAEYSISNRAEFEALVKKSLAMQQTDKTKKQQKRIPQITTRLEQIDFQPCADRIKHYPQECSDVAVTGQCFQF